MTAVRLCLLDESPQRRGAGSWEQAMKSQAPRLLIVAFAWLSFWIPGRAQQDWPPSDPDQRVTKTDFTVAWALKLAGFKTLVQLQKAAGSKGR